MVEEVHRLLCCDTREPEREFCQFDRHRVDVHAVDARFDNTAAPIGDFRLFLRDPWWDRHSPVGDYCIPRHPALSLRDDLLSHRARRRMLHDLVGKPFGGANKEVAAPHRGID